MIPCGNPGAAYRAHRAEIDAAVRRVLASGTYILGEEVSAFEKAFAEYLGTHRAVGVGNGTDALCLALRACGVERGDEVITVSHTASATIAAIVMSGATPVFADIEPDFYTMAPAALPELLTQKTKAIVPVHLYGQSADMAPILAFAEQHGLRVIEDCAQAAGGEYADRKLGTLGDIGCFSFYPTKNLGALGDGGMAVTRDPVLAERLRCLRQYGWNNARISLQAGMNSRLDELQAAVLNAMLPHLDEHNARRIFLADRYDRALAESGLVPPLRRPGSRHVFHLYVVRTRRQQALLAHLAALDIEAPAHYPVPAHLQPAYRPYAHRRRTLCRTEQTSQEVVSLPLYPEMKVVDQRRVIEAVQAFETNHE